MIIRLRIKGIKDIDLLMVSSNIGKSFTQYCKNAIIAYVRGTTFESGMILNNYEVDLTKEKQYSINIDEVEYGDVCDYLSNIKDGFMGSFVKNILRYYSFPYIAGCYMEDPTSIGEPVIHPQPVVTPISIQPTVRRTASTVTRKPKAKKETSDENIVTLKQDVRKSPVQQAVSADEKETTASEVIDERKISVLHAEPVKNVEESQESDTVEEDTSMDLLAGFGDLFSSIQTQYG